MSLWHHPTISSCFLLLLLPSIFPSIRVFSSESALHIRCPKCWGFNFSISPSKENSGLISIRIDWFDLLAVRGILKSLLQHYNLKASILWHSAFFMIHLSHQYKTTGETTALTIQTLISKVMASAFQYTKFVIAFLPKNKHLLISWLQSPPAVILEPKKKSATDSIFSHLFAMKWWD